MKRSLSILAAILVCSFSGATDLRGKVSIENALIDVVKDLCITGDTGKAAGELVKLASRDSSNSAVFFYLGRYELSNGNAKAAQDALERACALDPGNDDYAEELAKLYGSIGKGKDATDIYLRLLDRNPAKYRNAYTLTILADQQLYTYKDSLALDNYEAALLYDPGYAPAILGKSEIFRMRGNLPAFFATIKDFTTNPAIDPFPKSEYINSILQHVDGRTYQTWSTQLDSMVTDCVKTHPADSSTLKLAGRWFYGIGEKEKGKGYFKSLLENYPSSIEAHFINLQLLSEDNDLQGMISECRTILSLSDGNGSYSLPALSTIGDCYYSLGQKKTAYKWYEKALKADPSYLPVLNNYSYYLSLDGKRLAKAEKMSRITIEKEPDNPTYLDTYGWILHLCGRDKEAKPYFKHAMLYGGKESSEVLRHYSEVLKALGENDLSDYYKDLSEKKK